MNVMNKFRGQLSGCTFCETGVNRLLFLIFLRQTKVSGLQTFNIDSVRTGECGKDCCA